MRDGRYEETDNTGMMLGMKLTIWYSSRIAKTNVEVF